MQKNIAKIAFYLVALVTILWTSSLTVSFISTALPLSAWYVPFFALIVFDGGMLAWMKVYIDHAQGSWQRTISGISCGFDLIGVGLMAFAEILLGGQTFVAAPENLGTYAIWGVGIWTVVNVAAVITFHLSDPDARWRMAVQAEIDEVKDEAIKKLKLKRAQHSGRLSDQLSDGMMAQLEAELATDRNKDGIPDTFQKQLPSSPNGRVTPLATQSPVPLTATLQDKVIVFPENVSSTKQNGVGDASPKPPFE